MDSFIRFYELYRCASRWNVVKEIYSKSSTSLKFLLWITKLLFAITAIIFFVKDSFFPWLLISIAILMIWALVVTKARKSAYKRYYLLYPERIKYYAKEYQYIRYLNFKESLTSGPFMGDIDDAINHLDGQINSNSDSPIFSHPIVSILITVIITTIGSIAGKWDAITIAWVIFTLAIVLYFLCMLLGFTRTPLSSLKEFKRFLLWAKEDAII
ncbi:hypothetical protein V3C40_09150 [Janthinobacterium sp. LS2A]|uniref:hypothetical protein n=1 Tax=Janthinobacterium sp. LS2A TaxID=3118590 RepID=UPI002F91F91E